MGLRAGLDMMMKRKFPAPAGTRTSEHPARSPALYHWAIQAPVRQTETQEMHAAKPLVYELSLSEVEIGIEKF
jgi:hypothetical protein